MLKNTGKIKYLETIVMNQNYEYIHEEIKERLNSFSSKLFAVQSPI
jgi:hypothetical protein